MNGLHGDTAAASQSSRLNDLYLKNFGYRLGYVGLLANVQRERARVDIIQRAATGTLLEASPEQYSILEAAPIHMPMSFKNLKTGTVWQLPNEPLVSIGGSKNIVRTDLAGSFELKPGSGRRISGSVKENMGLNDYAITIQGIAVNEAEDAYPYDAVRWLRYFCELPESIGVVCPLLNFLGINLLAIEGWEFPAEEGSLSQQPYEIRCYSDFDVELLIQSDLATPAAR